MLDGCHTTFSSSRILGEANSVFSKQDTVLYWNEWQWKWCNLLYSPNHDIHIRQTRHSKVCSNNCHLCWSWKKRQSIVKDVTLVNASSTVFRLLHSDGDGKKRVPLKHRLKTTKNFQFTPSLSVHTIAFVIIIIIAGRDISSILYPPA